MLTIEEASRISAFEPDWFYGMSRTVAGRYIGNCVPPKVAETVGGLCMELLQSPQVDDTPAQSLPMRVRPACTRKSRVDKLLEAGLLDHGGSRDQTLEYTVGTTVTGDAALGSVLNWLPPKGCKVVLKERECTRSQPDDLYIYMQGEDVPFRSRAQLERQKKKLGYETGTA